MSRRRNMRRRAETRTSGNVERPKRAINVRIMETFLKLFFLIFVCRGSWALFHYSLSERREAGQCFQVHPFARALFAKSIWVKIFYLRAISQWTCQCRDAFGKVRSSCTRLNLWKTARESDLKRIVQGKQGGNFKCFSVFQVWLLVINVGVLFVSLLHSKPSLY